MKLLLFWSTMSWNVKEHGDKVVHIKDLNNGWEWSDSYSAHSPSRESVSSTLGNWASRSSLHMMFNRKVCMRSEILVPAENQTLVPCSIAFFLLTLLSWLIDRVNACVLELRNCSGKSVGGNLSSTTLFLIIYSLFNDTFSNTDCIWGFPKTFCSTSILQSE